MARYIESVLFEGEEIVYEGNYALWDNFWYILLSLGLFLPFIYYWQRFSEVAVTNYRVIAKKGIIRRSVLEYPIKKIESINIDQSIAGRIFNFGHITITGTGNQSLRIKNIKAPEDFKKHLAYMMLV